MAHVEKVVCHEEFEEGKRVLAVQEAPHNQGGFLKEASTYISAPSRMFDVILGTTSRLNFAKIDLLV